MSDLELEAARRTGFVEGLREAADEIGAWPFGRDVAATLRQRATRVEAASQTPDVAGAGTTAHPGTHNTGEPA